MRHSAFCGTVKTYTSTFVCLIVLPWWEFEELEGTQTDCHMTMSLWKLTASQKAGRPSRPSDLLLLHFKRATCCTSASAWNQLPPTTWNNIKKLGLLNTWKIVLLKCWLRSKLYGFRIMKVQKAKTLHTPQCRFFKFTVSLCLTCFKTLEWSYHEHT